MGDGLSKARQRAPTVPLDLLATSTVSTRQNLSGLRPGSGEWLFSQVWGFSARTRVRARRATTARNSKLGVPALPLQGG